MITGQSTQGHGPRVRRVHQSSRWWLCIAIGFGLLAVCDALIAAEYRLIKGRDFELCRALEQNLNVFKDDPPMVCERKFDARFKDFRVPNWEPLDAKENRDLLEQIYKAQFSLAVTKDSDKKFAEEKWLKFKPELEKKLGEGRVFLSKSRFDLAHNGEHVTVLKLVDNGCDPVKHIRFVNQPDPTLHVFVDDTTELDPRYARTARFMAEPFFYQGRVHLSEWNGLPNTEPPQLNVYETFWTRGHFGLPIYPICTYRYMN